MTALHDQGEAAPRTVASRGGIVRAGVRIARADLAGRPVQTALTALAIFAAATALVVTLALRSGLDDPFAAAQEATKGSHVAVYGDGDLAPLAQLPGVVADDLRPRLNVLTTFPGAPGSETLRGGAINVGLEALPAADAAVDVPRLTDGRRPASADEALVERSFAREFGLRVGDTLSLQRDDGTLEVTIAGLAVTTEQATYPRWRPGIVWAPASTVTQSPGAAQRLGVRLADPEATDAFIAAAQRALPHSNLRFVDWHEVRDTITDQARTNTIIIGVNTLLALIAVGFTVATVISGRVLAQRRQIGLLKAIGLTPRGVVALLVAEYAALALAAGVLGLVAGIAIAPLLLKPMSNLLATPVPSAFATWHAAALAGADRGRGRDLRRAARAARRAPEHRRRARARPRLAHRRRIEGRTRGRRAASPGRGPARRQGRVHEPLARRADRRRADDDGDHARRRALDGSDLRPRDRRPGAARQAVGPARRARRPGRGHRARDRPRRARRGPRDHDHQLPGDDAAGRAAGARARRRLPGLRRTPSRTGARSPAPARRSPGAASTSGSGSRSATT